MYERQPDIVERFRILADVVENRIDGLARMLTETNLVPNLAKLLEMENEEEQEP
jgi:hypothetical protein